MSFLALQWELFLVVLCVAVYYELFLVASFVSVIWAISGSVVCYCAM